MSEYKPTLGTRLRWVFIIVAVLWIGLLVYAGVSDAGCWTANQTKKIESPLGTDLAKARIVQKWCGNGNRITEMEPAQIYHKVTFAGSLARWHDEGVKNRESWYFIWRGTARGGHTAKATVHFHRDPFVIPLPQEEYLHMRIEVHADGSHSGDSFGNGGGAW